MIRFPPSLLSACLVLLVVVVQAPAVHGQGAGLTPPSKNDRWMTEIANAHPAYGNLMLSQALFPGAHDAGAYAPMSHFPSQDLPWGANFLSALVPEVIPVVHGWSAAQGGDFTSQLEAGVRYFDLRVCAPPPLETEPRLCHGFWTVTVDAALAQIGDFLNQPGRSKEIIIVNFERFHKFDEAMHDHTSRLIQNRLGGRLMGINPSKAARTTLREVWDSGRQVIALYPLTNRSTTFTKTNLWDRFIASPWPEEVEPIALRDRVTANLACRCDSKTSPPVVVADHVFFVLQIVATPDVPAELWGGPSPATDLRSLADLTNPELIAAVLDQPHPNLNIVAGDYVEESRLVEAIKNLTLATIDLQLEAAIAHPRAYLSRTDSPDAGPATVMTSWNGTHFGYTKRIEGAGEFTPAGDAPLTHFLGRLWSGGLRVTSLDDMFFTTPAEWNNGINHFGRDLLEESFPSLIDRLPFSGDIPGNYDSASFAAAYGRLYVAWAGPFSADPRITYRSSDDGSTFPADRRRTAVYQSFGSPALAASWGSLYAAWADLNGRLHLGRINSDDTFDHLADLGESVWYAPAMTGFRDRLIFAWAGTGSDHRIRVMSTDRDGNNRSAITTLGYTSAAPPSLAVFKGNVVLAHTGEDGRRYTRVSPDGLTFPADDWSAQGTATPNLFAKPVLHAWGDRTIVAVDSIKTIDGGDYAPGTWTRLDVKVTFKCEAPVAGQYGVIGNGDPLTPGDEFSPGFLGEAIASGPGANKSAIATCVDLSGHLGTAVVDNILQDTEPPWLEYISSIVTPPAPAPFGWHKEVVSSFKCVDGESGPERDEVSILVLTEGFNIAPSASCRDRVGNVGNGQARVSFNIDRTPPIIQVPSSYPVTTNGPAPVPVNYPAVAADALSGLVGTVTCDRPSGSLFPEGVTRVTCTAVDRAQNTGTAFFDVTVRINRPPSAEIVTGGLVNEGDSALFMMAAVDADGPLPLQYQVDCNDDGEYEVGPAVIALPVAFIACDFPDNGQRTVRARVTDGMGATSVATKVFTVANVAPSGTFANTGPVDEGTSFTLSLSGITDPSPADHAAGFQFAFDCGDGAGYGAHGPGAGRTCPAPDDAARSVRGKVRDKDGGEREYSASVDVRNIAPSLSSITSPAGLVQPLQFAAVTVTASDPGHDAVTTTVSWGDGSSNQYDGPGAIVATHAWTAPGIYTVTLQATDEDGATSTTASMTITVKDTIPPVFTFVPAPVTLVQTTLAGTPYAPGVATAVDSGGPDPVVSMAGVPAGNVFPVGVTTLTYVASDASGNVASATTTVTVVGNTTVGNSGPVQASDAVTVSFASVEGAGFTQAEVIEPAAAGELPDAFVSALFAYEVSTTAAVTGPITLCFTVPLDTDQATFDALRVLHAEGGILVDRTILAPQAPAPDFGARTLCALTDSLSPFLIALRDVTPPTIVRLAPSRSTLSPPNHQMTSLSLAIDATDNLAVASCAITAVTSNEPVNGTGDGDTAPDWSISGPTTLQLRAERSGRGQGRIYTVTVRCADAAGNASIGTTSVMVPKGSDK